MKKKLKKYQIAGQLSPCGAGYAWNEALQRCVPIAEQSPIIPLKSKDDRTFDPNAGSQDANGTFIPYKQWNPDAVDAGFNFDSDGTYRKKEFTETGQLAWKRNALGKAFPFINAALDATQLIANSVNTIKTNDAERRRLLEAKYQTPEYNNYEKGLNNVPVYFKRGGKVKQKGGLVNTTGYLNNEVTNQNPVNIIPNNNITTQNMAFPIEANGVPLYPNTGDYKFDTRFVVEKPLQMQAGGRTPITVTNPNDPRLKAYNDSLRVHNEYLSGAKEDGVNTNKLMPFQSEAQRKQWADEKTGLLPIGYYQHNDLDKYNSYWSAFKKPVQPVVYEKPQPKEPKFKRAITDTPDYPNMNVGQGRPIGTNPNLGMAKQDFTTPTKFAFTYQQPGYLKQESMYFKTLNELKAFAKSQGFDNVQQGADGTWGQVLSHKNVGKYQVGGNVDEVEGVKRKNANAMLEQGEVFLNQQGDINKVAESEPTHDQAGGGSPQPNVERVLEDTADKRKDFASKVLRITPAEVKGMFNFKPKKSLTHSKLYEEVIKRDRKNFDKFQKKIEANLDYIKANGGRFAKASLDENLKLILTFATEGERFDQIYEHQEAVKQAYNIEPMAQQKYQVGGSTSYPSTWRNYYDNRKKKQYTAPSWIAPTEFYGTPGLVDYMKTLDILPGVDNDLKVADDSVWGYRHQAALDKFFPNGQPAAATPAVSTPAGQGVSGTDGTVNTPMDNRQYTLPAENKPSTVNEGLGWAAGVGNVLGLLDTGRTPVNFEQLNRDYYKVHEEDATPTINATLGDYNATAEQLPNNGVGFANQANLQGQKYKFNNQAIAAVDSRNKQKFDIRDADVEGKKFQLDQLNLALRKQAETETLVGKEKQRQQKFEYLNGIFTAIDQKNAFNRNANLALQLTPFFDVKGQFNGNKYKIAMNYDTNDGGRVEYIQDKQTNQQYRVVYDKSGKIISSSKIVGDNKAVGSTQK